MAKREEKSDWERRRELRYERVRLLRRLAQVDRNLRRLGLVEDAHGQRLQVTQNRKGQN